MVIGRRRTGSVTGGPCDGQAVSLPARPEPPGQLWLSMPDGHGRSRRYLYVRDSGLVYRYSPDADGDPVEL